MPGKTLYFELSLLIIFAHLVGEVWVYSSYKRLGHVSELVAEDENSYVLRVGDIVRHLSVSQFTRLMHSLDPYVYIDLQGKRLRFSERIGALVRGAVAIFLFLLILSLWLGSVAPNSII